MMLWLLRRIGDSVAVPPVIPPASALSMGGPRPRRRYELDRLPEPRRERQPKRPKVRRRRAPPIRVALTLTIPSPVLLVDVRVVNLAPVAVTLRLPMPTMPTVACRVQVTNPLALAMERQDRIDDLEAVLAAVMEDD